MADGSASNPPRVGLEMRQAHFPGRAPVDAYGNGGFRFADMSHRGSVLMLPSGIFEWSAKTLADITPDSVVQIISEADAIEVCLFGCGPDMARIPANVREAMSAAGIKIDMMSTGAAVRTYNVMLAEDRAVAGAFLAVDAA